MFCVAFPSEIGNIVIDDEHHSSKHTQEQLLPLCNNVSSISSVNENEKCNDELTTSDDIVLPQQINHAGMNKIIYTIHF